ncbi:nucleoside 2-deoxyribosyltransferase [Rhodohalobacter sp. 8-1]|uniref:nucleoside 2-deoxyribosyltransferase n=1 Tax=Rhodohalobacter sp. 8-1 TaxID=3131972 RepID=UPI0030EC71BD
MKNIYFAGSIRGGRDDAKLYKQLIDELKTYGAVLTEHIGAKEVSFDLSDRHIHDRDLEWLSSSDILIAEVTTPSLGVGYEIGRAVSLEIPVVCLFRNRGDALLSAMIAGSPAVQTFNYSDLEEAKEILGKVFS